MEGSTDQGRPRILVLFAHPYPHASRMNRAMAAEASALDRVTVHDLYETYPDFHIDRKREQTLLLAHDCVVLQHPYYWYNVPALLKEWMDVVLEYGWAYGPGGQALAGKVWAHAVTTGDPEQAYDPAIETQCSIPELLKPFQRSATLCGMTWRAPFLLYGARHCSEADLAAHAARYRTWLEAH